MAYQILVASSPECLAKRTGDRWTAEKWIRPGRLRLNTPQGCCLSATRLVDSAGMGPGRQAKAGTALQLISITGLAQNEWTAHYVWDGTTT